MPKKRCVSVVLNQFVRDYDDFTTDGRLLFCKYCEVPVVPTKKFQVTSFQSGKQQASNKNRKRKNNQLQVLISALPKCGPKGSRSHKTLCKVFICADIPLAKLKNVLRIFLEKYTQENISDESTLKNSRLYR
jgi:hypothetical protein